MRYWEFSITNKFDNKNVLASCWRCCLFVLLECLLWYMEEAICVCVSPNLVKSRWYYLDFASFTRSIQWNTLNKGFHWDVRKKILNVLLPCDYVFCLSYEFRELPDNFLTNLENDFFWSMMEFFNISICFYKKKSNS